MWAYLASCKEWFDSAGDRDQTFASEPPSADAIRARRIQYYALRVALPLRQPTDLCLSPYIAACGSPPVPQNPFQGGLDHAVIWKRNPSQNPSQNPSRNPSRKPSQHPSLTLLSKDLSKVLSWTCFSAQGAFSDKTTYPRSLAPNTTLGQVTFEVQRTLRCTATARGGGDRSISIFGRRIALVVQFRKADYLTINLKPGESGFFN